MCKYCENLEEMEMIINEDRPFLEHNKIVVSVGITENKELSVCADLFSGGTVFWVSTPIRFCPVCGNEL